MKREIHIEQLVVDAGVSRDALRHALSVALRRAARDSNATIASAGPEAAGRDAVSRDIAATVHSRIDAARHR